MFFNILQYFFFLLLTVVYQKTAEEFALEAGDLTPDAKRSPGIQDDYEALHDSEDAIEGKKLSQFNSIEVNSNLF